MPAGITRNPSATRRFRSSTTSLPCAPRVRSREKTNVALGLTGERLVALGVTAGVVDAVFSVAAEPPPPPPDDDPEEELEELEPPPPPPPPEDEPELLLGATTTTSEVVAVSV